VEFDHAGHRAGQGGASAVVADADAESILGIEQQGAASRVLAGEGANRRGARGANVIDMGQGTAVMTCAARTRGA
jgi:hypothetical protein